KFEAAMNDDLNTSVALSVLFELVRLTQVLLEDSNTNVGVLNLVDVLFDRLGGEVLGIVKDEYPQAGAADEVVDKLVVVLIQQRNQARANKDFAKADELRDRLDEIGIVLEDFAKGDELRARLDEIGIVLEDKQDVTTWRTK
ncbi:MAG: DALR domain-containing protein, partial [Planctomycetota bacterium]